LYSIVLYCIIVFHVTDAEPSYFLSLLQASIERGSGVQCAATRGEFKELKYRKFMFKGPWKNVLMQAVSDYLGKVRNLQTYFCDER
jgi:hypothetical protein